MMTIETAAKNEGRLNGEYREDCLRQKHCTESKLPKMKMLSCMETMQ
jgi:hypothetical protein